MNFKHIWYLISKRDVCEFFKENRELLPISLNKLVKKARKEIKSKKPPQKVVKLSKNLSPWLLIAICLLFLLIYSNVITILFEFLFGPESVFFVNNLLKSELKLNISSANLIALISGIGVVVFALFIFIAEIIRKDQDHFASILILRKSNIFNLVVVGLAFYFFVLGDRSINFVTLIFIFLYFIWLLFSIKQTLWLISDRDNFYEEKVSLLTNLLKQSIDFQIHQRIGSNVLSDLCKKNNIKIKPSPFVFDDEGGKYRHILSEKEGYVNDINIRRLNEVCNFIEDIARKEGFSWGEGKLLDEFDLSISSTENKPEKAQQNQDRYLVVNFLDSVEEGDPIFKIDSQLFEKISPSKAFKIEKELLACIDINLGFEKQLGISLSEANKLIKNYLNKAKNDFIDAIGKANFSEVSQLSALYKKMIEAFLETIANIYNPESAQKERTSVDAFFMGGWRGIDGLDRDIYKFIDLASREGNAEIMVETLSLPMKIANMAAKMGDHLIFQEYTSLLPHCYNLIYKNLSKDRDRILYLFFSDRLEKFINYFVYVGLKKYNTDGVEVDKYLGYLRFVFKIYQNFLQRSFENSDWESYDKFYDDFQSILKNFNRGDYRKHTRVDFFRKQIEYLEKTSQEVPSEITERLKKEELIQKIKDFVKQAKEELSLGLIARFISVLIKNPSTEDYERDEKLDRLIQNLPRETKQLTLVYLRCSMDKIQNFWNWDAWNESRGYSGHAAMVPTDFNLAVAYVALVARNTNTNQDKLEIVDSEQILEKNRHFFTEDWSLHRAINHLLAQENYKKIESFIHRNTEDLRTICEKLKEAMKYVLEEIEKKKLEIKKSTPISPRLIEDFADGVYREYQNGKGFLELFEKLQLVKNKKRNPEKKPKELTINTIFDKGPFLENDSTHYLNFYENFADGFVNGENQTVWEDLEPKCKKIKFEDLSKTLNKKELSNYIIVLSHYIPRIEDSDEFFTPKWRIEKGEWLEWNTFFGFYKISGVNIPVLFIPSKGDEKKVLVLNKQKLGELIFYSSKYAPKNSLSRGNLFFDVIDLSFPKNLEEFMKIPPDWLKEHGDELAQKEYLKAVVKIQIWDPVSLSIDDSFEGYIMEFEESL